jgi:hypothetical protein
MRIYFQASSTYTRPIEHMGKPRELGHTSYKVLYCSVMEPMVAYSISWKHICDLCAFYFYKSLMKKVNGQIEDVFFIYKYKQSY